MPDSKVEWTALMSRCRLAIAALLISATLLDGRPACDDDDDEMATINKQLTSAADETVDPCQDFFQYACGGWIKTNPVPKTRSAWSQYDVLDEHLAEILQAVLAEDNKDEEPRPLRDARDMYAACMDTNSTEKIGLGPLTNYLTRTGGWPMALASWNESSFDWLDALLSARRTYGAHYLIGVDNDRDMSDTTKQAIYISRGSFTLPARNASLELVVTSAETTSAYRAYMIGSARAVRDWLGSGAADARIADQVDAVLAFEARLANISRPDEESRNMSAAYQPMSIAELQRWTDSVNNSRVKINWHKFINGIYSAADIWFPDTQVVIVDDKDYIKELMTLLESTPARVLANYIHWRLVDHLASDTTQQMLDVLFEFDKVHLGLLEPEPRSSRCAGMINFALGYALGARYVEKVFDDTSKVQIEEMVRNLRRAFKDLVDESTWMDGVTKAAAKEKADAMIHFVAYPDWLKNKTRLEQLYSGINVTRSSHFQNVQNVVARSVVRGLALFKRPESKTEWDTLPTVVNAFYSHLKNSIVFPAAILQLPYYGAGRPDAANYGALGSLIGHEITHAFDDIGRQFDRHGNVADWWTESTSNNYALRAKCFVDQYSNYTVLDGFSVNGVTTLGENMADNVGVRLALRAYEYHAASRSGGNGDDEAAKWAGLEKFSARQVFFLSYAHSYCGAQTDRAAIDQLLADSHSPARWRVAGSLANSDDFSEAFNCPADAPMNRAQKCRLW